MSKFDKIFEARETVGKTPDDKVTPAVNSKKSQPEVKELQNSKQSENRGKSEINTPASNTEFTETLVKATPAVHSTSEPRRGRPPAKRSDPDFIGFTTYVRKDTHLKVKIALLQEGKGRELSQLVEELLSSWVKKV